MITIDTERCTRCDACITECTYPFMFAKDPQGFPRMEAELERFCIRCGHCAAVCPSGAIRIDDEPTETLAAAPKAHWIRPEDAEQLLKSRRSVRAYKDQPVPHETLARLMEVTRWAASANNAQPIHWIVVETPAETHRLAGLVVDWLRIKGNTPETLAAWERGQDLVLRHAPHLVVACVDANRFWGATDSAIALTYLELAASAFGLGACWAGTLTRAAQEHAPIRQALGVPSELRVGGALMLGKPRFHYRRIPARTELDLRWV